MVRFKRQSRPVDDGGAIRNILLRPGLLRGALLLRLPELYVLFAFFGFLIYRSLAWFFGWE